jgi:PAS domain S-box-containing protein
VTTRSPGPDTLDGGHPTAGQASAGSGHSPEMDRLTALAARLVGVASAQVSLLSDVQTVAAGSGLVEGAVGSRTPLEHSLCTVTAGSTGPLIISDTTQDDRVAHLPPVTSGEVGAYLGVPLIDSTNQVLGVLCVFDAEPHAWSAFDVGVIEVLAGAVLSQLELTAMTSDYGADRLRWETAVEAAGIGSFAWNLVTDRVDWDERLQDLFGYLPGEFRPVAAEAFARIHPEDRARLDDSIEVAITSCGDFRAEYRVVLPDGAHRWIAARGRVVGDGAVSAAHLVGTAHDITELRTARDEAARLLEEMSTGFARVDRDWRMTYLNREGSRVIGLVPEDVLGKVLWDVFPGLDDMEFGELYRRAVDTGEVAQVEAWYDHLQGWYDVRAVPDRNGLSMYFQEVTARHEEQQRADAATARLELLARVSSELALSSLEPHGAIARLAQLMVPVLADWALVSLVEGEEVRDLGFAHRDPALQDVVATYAATRLIGRDRLGAVDEARRTQAPVVISGRLTEDVLPTLGSAEARDALVTLAPESAVVIPLTARGGLTAILTLCRSADRPAASPEEIATAREVGLRAGLALDNAVLYDQQRRLSEGLQRSLLTAPPEPDHLQIVVRYVAAAEAASVGGDWFDAFLQADGATVLVIGDVMGHDVAAAAAMGQMRSLLRGIAWYSGEGPAAVLAGVDAAMQGLQIDTTATAVIARLEQNEDERDRGVTRVRWSNAGHPPAMVLNPDRSVVVLGGLEADLLLGIDPETDRAESAITVDRGATLLLYTDGLVERRGQSLTTGLERLRRALVDLADEDLDGLCDALLDRLVPSGSEDDVALVAVRLHRQDRPRPAEAGPNRVPPALD